jgi:DNA-binding MarR family transcriptional regulator
MKPAYTSKDAAREPCLAVIRELVRAYQAFEAYSSARIREMGLTPPQFDVIATLGNTPGMSFKELGEKTLITKGTLTGVVDRLQEKGLVSRETAPDDRRSFTAKLTQKGEQLFEAAFPAQVAHMKARLGQLSSGEREQAIAALRQLRSLF